MVADPAHLELENIFKFNQNPFNYLENNASLFVNDKAFSSFKDWLLVLGNEDLKLKILKARSSKLKSSKKLVVRVNLRGLLKDGKVVDRLDGVLLVVGDEDYLTALDLCLPFMNLGETGLIITHPRFAYGKYERTPDIPGNSHLVLYVELIEIKDKDTLSEEEIINLSISRHKKGNDNFLKSNYEKSVFFYKKALDILLNKQKLNKNKNDGQEEKKKESEDENDEEHDKESDKRQTEKEIENENIIENEIKENKDNKNKVKEINEEEGKDNKNKVKEINEEENKEKRKIMKKEHKEKKEQMDGSMFVQYKELKFKCYNNLTISYVKLQDPYLALESCNKALEINPTNDKALYRKAKILNAIGENEKAIESLTESCQLFPQSKEFQALLKKIQFENLKAKKMLKNLYTNMFPINNQSQTRVTSKLKLIIIPVLVSIFSLILYYFLFH